jgi:hypothetical protein
MKCELADSIHTNSIRRERREAQDASDSIEAGRCFIEQYVLLMLVHAELLACTSCVEGGGRGRNSELQILFSELVLF